MPGRAGPGRLAGAGGGGLVGQFGDEGAAVDGDVDGDGVGDEAVELVVATPDDEKLKQLSKLVISYTAAKKARRRVSFLEFDIKDATGYLATGYLELAAALCAATSNRARCRD